VVNTPEGDKSMAARKRGSKKKPKKVKKPVLVRKTVLIEQEKLDFARKALELPSDAEVLRFCLDHLLSHFHHHDEEE
jgi:hypothetical protein